MVRNLQAATHAFRTAQAQKSFPHAPVTSGVARSPKAAWTAADEAAEQASSRRLAAAILPDDALIEAMQHSQQHGRHWFTNVSTPTDDT
jgi:hypothetical protein